MAHLLDGNKGFVGFGEPAWHKLGTVFQTPFTAVEGLAAMDPYEVEARPVPGYADMPDLSIPYQHLVRLPNATHPAGISYGVVGPEYHLITPRRLPIPATR